MSWPFLSNDSLPACLFIYGPVICSPLSQGTSSLSTLITFHYFLDTLFLSFFLLSLAMIQSVTFLCVLVAALLVPYVTPHRSAQPLSFFDSSSNHQTQRLHFFFLQSAPRCPSPPQAIPWTFAFLMMLGRCTP